MDTLLYRHLFLTLLLSLGFGRASFAQTDESLIKSVVEGYLNGYLQSFSGKHEEARRDWIYKNIATTSAFKDAYRRMEKVAIARWEADPGDSGLTSSHYGRAMFLKSRTC
jgi:hypothetical protein